MSTSHRPRGRTAAFVAAGLFALLAGALIWFLSGEPPAEVDIRGTVADLDADGGQDTAAPAATAGADGTWVVRTDVEPFDLATSTGSFVGFRIDEELSTLGAVQAVGRMPAVTGSLSLDGTVVREATFSGEVASLLTDQSRRDSRARRAIGGDAVTFTLTEPIELDGVPAPGTTLTATAVGDLTVNGVTDTVQVPLQAALSTSGVLVVTASFDVLLSDHDVAAPSAPMVVSVSDTATVEVQLLLTRTA